MDEDSVRETQGVHGEYDGVGFDLLRCVRLFDGSFLCSPKMFSKLVERGAKNDKNENFQ